MEKKLLELFCKYEKNVDYGVDAIKKEDYQMVIREALRLIQKGV